VARFRQINQDNPSIHHDALEFPGGLIVLLTRLCTSQRATVLQLPAAPRSKNESKDQKRVALVCELGDEPLF
jgi:hypothetical protein